MTAGKVRRRGFIAVVIGLVIAGTLLLFRHDLQRASMQRTVLREDEPDEESLTDAVESAPVEMVQRLWRDGRTVQRSFAMSWIGSRKEWVRDNWTAMRPVVLAAAHTRDVDLQQAALRLLVDIEPATATAESLVLLNDVDPEVRLVGVRSLGAVKTDDTLWPLVRCLRDTEETVILSAQSALVIRTRQPLDQLNMLDPTDSAKGILAWEEYLRSQSIAAPTTQSTLPADFDSLPLTDIELKTLDGKRVRISQLAGKRVVLNFWATWCGPCLMELPTLQEVHAYYGDDVVILGICADLIPDEEGHQSLAVDPVERVKAVMSKYGITYPVAIDTAGKAMGIYARSGVPMTILIDRQGHIRRRAIGTRSTAAMKAMIDELK